MSSGSGARVEGREHRPSPPAKGEGMSAETVDRVMHDYVEALNSGGDLSAYFADDATFTTMETGEVVRGRDAIAAYISMLHHEVFAGRVVPRHLVTADGVAVL